MRIVQITGKHAVEVVDLETPDAGPGEALLRVLRCGICGSDLHAWRGSRGYNSRPGHEFCAVVERLGPDAGGLEAGMRVTGECFTHCGGCEACLRGDYNHCDSIDYSPARPGGALADLMAFPVGALLAVSEALSDAQAAMVEPLAVAFRAVSRAHVAAGETVAVVGAGTIGLLCAAVARAKGASRIFLLCKHAHQAHAALALGVSNVLSPGSGDPKVAVREATEGRGVDAVIDSVALGTSLTTALALARSQGRVVEVGGVTRPLLVGLNPLVDQEIQLTGSNCYATTDGRRDLEWAVDLIASGQVSPEVLITHTYPLAEAAEAFRTAADKQTGSIKVMVTMAP